jgi:hypothetical protein
MHRWIKFGTIAATAALFMGCVSLNSNENGLKLIGNFPNPSAPVLSGLCLNQCQANACTDYNTISDACVRGLPIQGMAAAEVLTHFCPINNYSLTAPATGSMYIQLPASCVGRTPAAVASPAVHPSVG